MDDLWTEADVAILNDLLGAYRRAERFVVALLETLLGGGR